MISADYTTGKVHGHGSFLADTLRKACVGEGSDPMTRRPYGTLAITQQGRRVATVDTWTGRCVIAVVAWRRDDDLPLTPQTKIDIYINHPLDAVETHRVGDIVQMSTGTWCCSTDEYLREEVIKHVARCLGAGLRRKNMTAAEASQAASAVIVTRHPALQRYLQSLPGLTGVPVVEHAGIDDVEGKVVFGVLPLHLARWAKFIVEYPLDVPAELRGVELSDEEFRKYVGVPHVYTVTCW